MSHAALSRRSLLASAVALATTGAAGTLRSATSGSPGSTPLRLTLLGQSLIQQDLCLMPWTGMDELARRLHAADVVFTDLETAITGPLAGAPTRAGDSNVLHVAGAATIDCLRSLGINLYATSNNHAWDLGAGGIQSALDALDTRGLAHAGSGRTLAAASDAGIRSTPRGDIALVAAAAGAVRDGAAAAADRAGVNELRRAADGSLLPADVDRTLAAIRAARSRGASVVAYLHNHYWESELSVTPEWQRSYARACVDAGAAVFVAHGPPLLQGIELYRGAPLLHGLGSLIFQTRKTDGSYGPATWQSAAVELTLLGGRVSSAVLLPIRLDPESVPEGAGHITLGVPSIAAGGDAGTILAALTALSRPFGFQPRRRGDTLVLI